MVGAAGTGWPQDVQNTVPSPNLAPHFEQNIFLQWPADELEPAQNQAAGNHVMNGLLFFGHARTNRIY
jgi:hypothetical protein